MITAPSGSLDPSADGRRSMTDAGSRALQSPDAVRRDLRAAVLTKRSRCLATSLQPPRSHRLSYDPTGQLKEPGLGIPDVLAIYAVSSFVGSVLALAFLSINRTD
jgi:hypothetical protein